MMRIIFLGMILILQGLRCPRDDFKTMYIYTWVCRIFCICVCIFISLVRIQCYFSLLAFSLSDLHRNTILQKIGHFLKAFRPILKEKTHQKEIDTFQVLWSTTIFFSILVKNNLILEIESE